MSDIVVIGAGLFAAFLLGYLLGMGSNKAQRVADVMMDWGRLREQAEELHELQRFKHDTTGEHSWLDVTSFASGGVERRCQFCEATEFVR